MTARHIYADCRPDCPELDSGRRQCRGVDPVEQMTISGALELVCAGCQHPLELLPEPMSLWNEDAPCLTS